MPPKMKKKGRSRGAETMVIGLPQEKKQKGVISKPKRFSKLSPLEKDRVILECFTNKVNVVAAIDGSRLLSIDDLFGFNAIPDTVRDENIDIHRVEKYFNQTGWYAALENFHKKEKSGWTCLACHKHISKEESSVICGPCLRWCHLSCTNLKRPPKTRNWFCKVCAIKFIQKSFSSERLCTLIESKILV